jgi:hypothetical protein
MSPKQLWSWHLVAQQPSCFLSLTWHGGALYGLGVQHVKVLIRFYVFLLPSVSPVSQQDF